ncbi:MAG: transketolase [Candidatus Kerfeldbacteria bacterium]
MTETKELALIANAVRQDLLRALNAAKSGHPAGSLGMADVFTVLYFHSMMHDPKKPNWPDRDRLVLSNGHICPVMYAAMAHAGYLPVDELLTLRKLGSRLQGHPHRSAIPGLETSSGPLGCGLAQACGMAAAARLNKKDHHIFTLTSDGEHEEGNMWESVMFAAKYKLDNIIQIMDRNYIQIDGNTEDVMPLDPVREKYEAFNWNVLEVDGHNIEQIIDAINRAKYYKKKPTLIVAITVPGKGVSFMEDDFKWHGKAPDDDELEKALAELEDVRNKITDDTYDY